MLLKGENCFFCAKLPTFLGIWEEEEGRRYIELTGTLTEVRPHLQICHSLYWLKEQIFFCEAKC